MEWVDHAATGHLDTPKERALRNDYEDADFEVQQLKQKLSKARMVGLSEEAEQMFAWRRRALRAEELLRKAGLAHQLE